MVSRSFSDEVLHDGDQDGIPDYLDAIDQPAILQGVEGNTEQGLLITEAGLRLRLGAAALAAGQYAAGVTLQDIDVFASQSGGIAADINDALIYPNGFFDFEITGMSLAGKSVQVVISQPAQIGEGAVYRKYHFDHGWQDFVFDSRNSVASAPGSRDSCPEPGADDYRSGLHAGDYCVQLTLEDGGANDADGRRNGIIRDPGGVGMTSQLSNDGAASGGGGGGGGCTVGGRTLWDPSLPLLVLVSAMTLIRRRFT